MIHHDGELESRTYRLPRWLVRGGLIALSTGFVLVVLGAVLYTPIARTAAKVPGLNREVARLRQENEQVNELARTLTDAESRYDQIRGMLGGDIIPEVQRARVGRLVVARPLFARSPGGAPQYETGLSVPRHWPLEQVGVVTRGQISPGTRDETHSGVDIAVPMGTAIRASGGGIVVETGEDPEYGVFVRLDHPDDYHTIYGHASRLLVEVGDTVSAGQVIALSGSTGRSTGPHLHFEIRRGGQSVDPRSIVKEEF
ncbi:MAG TPA: M23 family metallopeptidase [Gemmatimonadales bacterium]